MKWTMYAKSAAWLLRTLLLGVVLLLPVTASANGPHSAREHPLTDFFWDNFSVPQDCNEQVDYLHVPMPWDLTTSWDVFPAGYVVTFRSHGMFPDPQGWKSLCQVDQWWYQNQQKSFYEGTMTGQIIERPLPDGTAMIHATLRYDDLPFRVYPLSIYTACDTGPCNTDLYKPIVVDGRMTLQHTEEFAIERPGALLSIGNIDLSHQFIATGQGVGTFTGEGGFPKGKTALVRLTQIGTPGRAVGDPHWDGFPVEKIEITVQK